MRNALKFLERMPSSYQCTPDEVALIAALNNSTLTHELIWNGSVKGVAVRKDRDALKKKLKEFLLLGQNGYCYYCGFKFIYRSGERASRAVQRDHIAPKSIYFKLTFETRNLILACARCNSGDYKSDTDTVKKASTLYQDYEFKIIHPYFDNFSNHLVLQDDGTLKLQNKSVKGRATKKMFGLDESFAVQERATANMYDKYKVDTMEDLKIAWAMEINRSI